MLAGKLALFDIADVEAFCNANLDQNLKRWNNAHLEPCDREDALAYVLSETWRLSLRYDHHRSPSFERFARPYQQRFLIQFYRDRFVDTRYKRRYTDQEWAHIEAVVFASSIDTFTEDGEPRDYPAAPEHQQDPVEFSLRAITGDASSDCDPDLARILNRRDQPSNRVQTRPDPTADDRPTLRAA